jgi:hypothetical protein
MGTRSFRLFVAPFIVGMTTTNDNNRQQQQPPTTTTANNNVTLPSKLPHMQDQVCSVILRFLLQF